MSNLADTISKAFMRPGRKEDVISYIKGTSLSAPYRRKLLQDWATRVGVDLTGSDYKAVIE